MIFSGEKPFRCLLKTCLKRFRYKGDLSKHIKRYHPGHNQQLTPVPLQEDEIANMTSTVVVTTSGTILSNNVGGDNSFTNNRAGQQQSLPPRMMLATSGGSVRTNISQASTSFATTSTNTTTLASTSNNGAGNSSTFASEDRRLLFVPLLPQHPVQQAELLASGFSKEFAFGPSDSLGIDCMDPSLDENFLDLLTKDEDGGILELSPPSPPPLPPPPPPPPQASSKLHEALTRVNRVEKKSTTAAFVVPSSTGLVRPRLTTSNLNWGDSIKIEPGILASNSTSTSKWGDTIKLETSKWGVVDNNIKIEPGTSGSNSASGSKWTDTIKLEPITSGTRSPMTLSISQVFACAQPLPLQEDAKHNSRGKMTTLADLEPRTSPMTFSLSPSTITLKSPQQQLQQQPTQVFRRVINTKDLHEQLFTTVANTTNTPATTTTTTTTTTVLIKNHIVKPFRCEHPGCNKSFDKATLLRRHSKLHSSECKFVCDVCAKCFESQSKLDDHYRKHTGAKPFSCHVCFNTFRYKGISNELYPFL